jgi:hypothetical protein
MRTLIRGTALAAIVLCPVLFSCENWNQPIKSEIEYYLTLVPVDTWEQVRETAANAEPGYTILVLNDIEASGDPVVIDGKALTITGRGRKTISRNAAFFDSFFVVENGGSLTIGNSRGSLVLDGNKDAFLTSPSYPTSLITVNEGNLVLNNSTLRNNICNSMGGGVYFDCPVNSSGFFTMNNSAIRENTAELKVGGISLGARGGGVFFKCSGNGSFTMNNSVIAGNIIESGAGGGVYFLCDGTGRFVMTDSKIEDNHAALPNRAGGEGGGVSFFNTGQGSFTMNNSVIQNNTGFVYGGGVGLTSIARDGSTASAAFIMNSGTISGNAASVSGGGVYVYSSAFDSAAGDDSTASAVFTMNGGTISGNTAVDSGGSASGGGGVYFGKFGDGSSIAFTKEPGGLIYGKNEDEKSNLVKDGSGAPLDGQGHAVYFEDGPRIRDNTAGKTVSFDGTWSDES